TIVHRLRVLRLAHLHNKAVAAAADHRLDISLLAHLGGEHEGRGKRYVHLRKGRIGTFDGARPEPSDDGELLTHVAFQVPTFFSHVRGDLNFRIKVADTPFRFFS